MIKKLLFIFFILFLLAAGGIVYLNKVFLPIQLKEIISLKSKEFLHREISYKEIVFEPLKGLVIKDLVVYEKDASKTPFIKVEEAYARILLPSVFKEFKILIPSIVLRQPYVHLWRSPAGEWNYADLLTPRKPSGKTPFSVMVGGFSISEGRIQITDRFANPLSMEVWDKIRAQVHLALNKSLSFDIDIPEGPQKASLKAKGHYFFTSNDIVAELSAQNLNVAKYVNLFYPIPGVTLRRGFIEQAKISLTHKKDNDDIRGQWQGDMDCEQGPARRFRGQINLQNLNFSRQKNTLAFGLQLTGKGLDLAWDGYAFEGDVTTRGLELTSEGLRGKANGEMELKHMTAMWAGENSVTGDVSLRELRAEREGNDFSIKFALSAEGVQATLAGNAIESSVEIPNVSFARKGLNFTGNANLSLSGLNAKLADGTKIAGDITAKNFILDGTASNFQMASDLKAEKLFLVNNGVTAKSDSVSLPWKALSKNNQIALLFSPVVSNLEIPLEKKQTVNIAKLTGQDIKANLQDKKFFFEGTLLTEGFVLKLPENQELSAAPQLTFQIQEDPADETPLRYQGRVRVDNATFKGAPVVGDVQQISGSLAFENDQASSEKLSFRALNTPITASGSVKNFQKPTAKIKAAAEGIALEALQPFLDSYLKSSGIKPSGKADAVVSFTGPLQAPEKAQINATVTLREAQAEGGNLPGRISKISGTVRYSPDTLSWEDLHGVFQNTRYTLNGDLANFKKPLINLKIESEDLILTTQFKMNEDFVTISDCSGRYLDSGFEVAGKVQLGKSSDPYLDISGHLNLNLSDLPLLNPGLKNLKDLKPDGDLTADFTFKGRPKDYARGKISVMAKGSEISFNTYKIRDFKLDFRHGESEFGKIKLTGNFYGGDLDVDGFTSIQKDPPTFHVNANLTGTDLALIRKDNKWSGQDVSGTLSAMAELQGPMTDTKEIRGKASFLIRDGVLWEMNFLRGLFKALLIPELGNVAFTEASANFTVADEKFQTNDLFFKGTIADLMAKGWIDFKGRINIDVTPDFKQLDIAQSDSMRKGPTAILADMGGLTIKVTGTLKSPQYLVKSLPTKVLQKTTETILDGVQGIVDGILNQ